tara:strand:+ start:14332 stop:15369 length:1038 start_codon:yes stop_codon:yes gene_type:complete
MDGELLPSLLSYFSYLLLVLYFLLCKDKGPLNKWMIVIGILYYLIGSLQYIGEFSYLLTNAAKYFIMVICGYELIRRTTETELFIFLLLGAITVLIHALFIPGGSALYGRFSGFYINPNGASFICGSGYALSYAIKNKRIRLIGQLVFTFMGLLTLSRTFIATWILLNLISLNINIRNIKIFFYGFGLVLLLLGMSELFKVKNARIDQLKRITNNEEVTTEELDEEGRGETWAKYYDDILENPILGSGYNTAQGGTDRHGKGTHNTFLLIIAEAGILAFLVYTIFYFYLLTSSIRLFNYAPNIFMQLVVLILFLLVSHIYFTHHFILLISMWIQKELKQKKIELA